MITKIFISYRSDHTILVAQLIYLALLRKFGRKSAFMDIYNIPPGEDFPKTIESELYKCNILLAIIDKSWLSSINRKSPDNSHIDFVQKEIAVALKRKIHVLPILVDGADTLKSTDLPEDIRDLADKSPFHFSSKKNSADIALLIKELALYSKNVATKEKKDNSKITIDIKKILSILKSLLAFLAFTIGFTLVIILGLYIIGDYDKSSWLKIFIVCAFFCTLIFVSVRNTTS